MSWEEKNEVEQMAWSDELTFEEKQEVAEIKAEFNRRTEYNKKRCIIQLREILEYCERNVKD